MSIFWRCASIYRAAVLTLGLCAQGAAFAATTPQPLDAIVATAASISEAQAKLHGYDNVAVEVRPLDKRLRLPLCAEPLQGRATQSSHVLGIVSVRVECAAPKPWSLYVRARVTAQRAVPVLVRPLARHTTVSAVDLKLINMPVDSVANGIIFDPDQIIGMELVRPLDSGSAIRVNQLRAPDVVKRGQLVTLVAGAGGLEVKVQGKALGNAAAGERVAVSNPNSGKRVEGTVNRDGTVTVR